MSNLARILLNRYLNAKAPGQFFSTALLRSGSFLCYNWETY